MSQLQADVGATREGHPMMPQSTHDEQARQAFVLNLKQLANGDFLRATRELCSRKINSGLGHSDDHPAPALRHEVRRMMQVTPAYQVWSSLLRTSQELLWDYVGESVDRQAAELEELAASAKNCGGSLRLDADFQLPPYLAALDQHIMPGGYGYSSGDGDLRAGAVYDRGAALYHMGQVNLLNDVRGHTLAAYLRDAFGDLQPLRILDMGCTVGHSTLVLCDYFPEAEIHAIDVGASVLRYADARARHLGKAVHFSQQSAESTDFDSGSFDLVISSAMFHETSRAAVPAIMTECARLLRPGGVVAHAEVPVRYGHMKPSEVLIRDWQTYNNGEPFWGGCATTDFDAALADAGFEDRAVGYQPACRDANDPQRGRFSEEGDASFRYWYVFGGRAPQTGGK